MKNTCNYRTNISIIFVANKSGLYNFPELFMFYICTALFLLSVNRQILIS
jgi:hypothetical protein